MTFIDYASKLIAFIQSLYKLKILLGTVLSSSIGLISRMEGGDIV